MKFESENHGMGSYKADSISDVIGISIDKAPSYYSRGLDALEEKFDKLVDIVGKLAARLPEADQAELARRLGYRPEGSTWEDDE